jgi:asparagine synthetase B (glutamine-hydrolysing)
MERLNYNFNPADIADENFAALFEQRRRDSIFAYVYEKRGLVYALRDHLGAVPLFYRRLGDNFQVTTNLSALVRPDDEVDTHGLRLLIGLGSPKLRPPVKGIEIVPPGAAIELNKATGECRLLYQYKLRPQKISPLATMRALVAELDRLFLRAMTRAIRADKVGLYLSGGIDSALIGFYLKQLGVRVNVYTSAPWGKISSEIPIAQANAQRIGVHRHHLDLLETDKYLDALNAIPKVYGLPHGTSTGIGVASLWRHTPINREQQVFFGQNSDTMTCSVSAQYVIYFTSFLPANLRRRLGVEHNDLLKNYLALTSRKFVDDYPPLNDVCDMASLNRVQRLTVAGMYAAHSPSDGEVLSQPAIYAGIPTANPYYDMDLVEFCLGIPLRHRIALSRETRLPIALEKKVFRARALKYLPREVVYRKKGFTVSMERDETTRRLADLLPTEVAGVPVKDTESRVAAGIFARWCELNGLVIALW